MQAARFSEVPRSLVFAPFEFQMLSQEEMGVRLGCTGIRQPQVCARRRSIEGMLALRPLEHPIANGFNVD